MATHRSLKAILKETTQVHGSVDIAPQIDSTVTYAGIVRESPVDILYERNPVTGQRYIKVKVWCKTKPGLFRFTHIKVAGSEREMQQKCGVVAGVMAEQLCALYGNLAAEPSECAKYAGRHFHELCEHLRRQNAA
jgi:hypothetical protein